VENDPETIGGAILRREEVSDYRGHHLEEKKKKRQGISFKRDLEFRSGGVKGERLLLNGVGIICKEGREGPSSGGKRVGKAQEG